jgi:transcriptional regulator with XRE-family HTH domain
MNNMDYIIREDNWESVIEQEKKRVGGEIVIQLLQARKKLGLTQQQLADCTGMKRSNIARIEGQKYTPTLEVLVKLADSMGMCLAIQLVDKNEINENF